MYTFSQTHNQIDQSSIELTFHFSRTRFSKTQCHYEISKPTRITPLIDSISIRQHFSILSAIFSNLSTHIEEACSILNFYKPTIAAL